MNVHVVFQSVCVGNAQLITPNLPALNGYIHIIDRVSSPAHPNERTRDELAPARTDALL